MSVLPYKDQNKGKKEQVATMFDNISARYDLLNHLLSLGIDVLWRKKAIRMLRKRVPAPKIMLDVATGTGDFALEALSLQPDKIIGIDISAGMLEVGRQKMKKRRVDNRIDMVQADSENLPFEDNKFDAVIVAFGVRNFEDLKKRAYGDEQGAETRGCRSHSGDFASQVLSFQAGIQYLF
jgi:demethylmenaquinone methyltransferase/2-methoxy-6-polyprenyl-1,4-benzoquinol methylase